MSIDTHMEDGEIIMWSALAARNEKKISQEVYSRIISGEVNPMEFIQEEFLERRLYKIGGGSRAYYR